MTYGPRRACDEAGVFQSLLARVGAVVWVGHVKICASGVCHVSWGALIRKGRRIREQITSG